MCSQGRVVEESSVLFYNFGEVEGVKGALVVGWKYSRLGWGLESRSALEVSSVSCCFGFQLFFRLPSRVVELVGRRGRRHCPVSTEDLYVLLLLVWLLLSRSPLRVSQRLSSRRSSPNLRLHARITISSFLTSVADCSSGFYLRLCLCIPGIQRPAAPAS